MIQKENLELIETKSSDPCIHYGEVTPKIAAKWLSFNTENRNARPVVLNRYVDAMNKGLWEENFSVIRFRNDGVLLDGQHRLQAVVKSGKAFPFLVITGQEKTHHMDDGASRSVRDLIQMFNYSLPSFYRDCHVIASANLAMSALGDQGLANNKAHKCDPKEVEDWIARHEDAIRVFAPSRRLKGGKKGYATYNLQSAPILLSLIAAYEAGVDENVLFDWIAGAARHEYTEANCCSNAMVFEKYYADCKYHGGSLKEALSIYKVCCHNILLTEKKQRIKSIRPYDKIDFQIPR